MLLTKVLVCLQLIHYYNSVSAQPISPQESLVKRSEKIIPKFAQSLNEDKEAALELDSTEKPGKSYLDISSEYGDKNSYLLESNPEALGSINESEANKCLIGEPSRLLENSSMNISDNEIITPEEYEKLASALKDSNVATLFILIVRRRKMPQNNLHKITPIEDLEKDFMKLIKNPQAEAAVKKVFQYFDLKQPQISPLVPDSEA